MATYFDELGWSPEEQNDVTQEHIFILNMLRLGFGGNVFADLDIANNLPPPASKAVVDNLPQEQVNKQGETCSVCLKDYEISTLKTILPCKHNFHSKCILPWLTKTNSCPLCRHELPTDNEEYENNKKEKLRAKEREERLQELHSSMFT